MGRVGLRRRASAWDGYSLRLRSVAAALQRGAAKITTAIGGCAQAQSARLRSRPASTNARRKPMEVVANLAPHVLALDDDRSIRGLIADYLSANELRVTTVATGRELAEAMARDTVDMVIL